MPDQIDRKALELLEQGYTKKAIAEQTSQGVSNVSERLRHYRDQGVLLDNDSRVDWQRFEEIPVLSRRGSRNTGAIPSITERNAEEVPGTTPRNASAIPGTTERSTRASQRIADFTDEEIEAMRFLVHRELARKREARSGETETKSFRLDTGLLDLVKDYADREGITTTEAIHRSVEFFFSRKKYRTR